MPNYMAMPNREPSSALQRALDAYEALQQQLMSVHAPEFAALDITMAQAKLLYVVAVAPDATMSEVAQRLGVAISTASGAVDHLVVAGYLTRFDDPTNRRQVRVSVTPHGLATLEGLRELGTRQLRSMLERINDEDLETVEQAMRIMTVAMTAPAPAPDGPHPTAIPAPSPGSTE